MMEIAPQTFQVGINSAHSACNNWKKKTFLFLIAKDTLKKPPRNMQEMARKGEQMRETITFRK